MFVTIFAGKAKIPPNPNAKSKGRISMSDCHKNCIFCNEKSLSLRM